MVTKRQTIEMPQAMIVKSLKVGLGGPGGYTFYMKSIEILSLVIVNSARTGCATD